MDVCRLVYLHGGTDFVYGLRWLDLLTRLDGGLRSPCPTAGALPAQIRQIHRPRFRGRSLLLQYCPLGSGIRGHFRLPHLRRRTNARGGDRLQSLPSSGCEYWRGYRDGDRRIFCRLGRDERDYLDSGGSVRGADYRLSDSRDRHLNAPHGQPRSPTRI